jgi:hypothetical protein
MHSSLRIRRVTKAVASATAAAALIAGIGLTHPAEATGGLPVGTLGQYLGFDQRDRFVDAESSLGTRLDRVITMADSRSPQEMLSSVWGQFARTSAYLPGLSHRLDVTVTIPLAFGRGGIYEREGPEAVRQGLAKTTSGAYDSDYRLVAKYLIAAGYGDAVLRLGHEFDGTWEPWSARKNEQAYINAFRHVRNIFKQESAAFRYEWTGMHGPWRAHAKAAYPGNAYVDIIGLDIYYRDQAEITTRQWEDEYRATLIAHRDFAISMGKPVSYPEWGRAFADTPRFVTLMHDWFSSLPKTGPGRLEYQAYFNEPGQNGRYDLKNLPAVKQRYVELFRRTSTAAQPTTQPTSTPTTQPTSTLEPATRLSQVVASNPPTGEWTATQAAINATLVNGTLAVSWYHPEAARYEVRYRAAGSNNWTGWFEQSSRTSFTASGLPANTSYVIEVKMHKIPLWYPWRQITVAPTTASAPAAAPVSTPTTTAPAPAAPTTVATDARASGTWTATEAAISATLVKGTLAVSWYHPEAARYEVRYRAAGSNNWTGWFEQSSRTSFTASGLPANTSYVIEVKMHKIPLWYPWRQITVAPT